MRLAFPFTAIFGSSDLETIDFFIYLFHALSAPRNQRKAR